MYAVVSTNLTGLGSPMGTEKTWTNWRKYTRTIALAKKLCEKDYIRNGGTRKVTWYPKPAYKGYITSGDLNFVEYNINKIKLEQRA